MRRQFRALLLTSAAIALPLTTPGHAEPLITRGLNSYGMPGAVDTPTAESVDEGTLAASVSVSDYGRRNSVIFQLTPRLTAALRYSKLDGVERRVGYLWDRSFDVHYQLFDEEGWRPAIAAGLRDFMGTGVYSAEYLVATKTVTPDIRVSAGVGWGRLAGAWRRTEYGDEGGRPNVDQWFTGPAKPFASVTWQATDRLRLSAEYAHDDYELEVSEGNPAPGRNWNLGANYRLGDNYQLSAYTIGGEVWGAQVTIALNAKKSPYPSGLESAPAPVRPRPARGADPDGWSGAWSQDPTAQPAIQTALADALADEGQVLESMALRADRAEIRIRNTRYIQQAEAIGRAARLMTRALPPSVETLVITSVERGMATSSVTLKRSDVERLENTAAAQIAAVAQVGDAQPRSGDLVAGDAAYPRYRWALKPYLSTHVFDARDPLKYEIGAALSAQYEAAPGVILSGELRQRAFGTIGDLDRVRPATSRNVVRSDAGEYAGNDGPTIEHLTAAWYQQLSPSTYGRVTAGLLEAMYGGVSAEVLWKPNDSRLALGAEINHVRKRDTDKRFSFQDYETTTGHLSAYYDFGNGFQGQLDVGRYLAGDVGATVAINREFANGWRVGAYATKTNMSREEFGEGSFDKGISVSIPLGWAIGTPSRSRVTNELRSLNRDGGARVKVDGRLYDTLRDSQKGKIYDGWGRFWR